MAIVKGGILGNFSGKIGNFNARIVNGQTILSARPKHQKISKSPKCIETRQKFRITIAFASAVSDLPSLHEIWGSIKKPNMTVFNMVFKCNYGYVTNEAVTLNNIITPEGFYSPVKMVELFSGKLIGSLEGLNTVATISCEETDISINAVICLLNPGKNSEPFYKFISLSKEVSGFDFSQQYDFEIDLSPINTELSKKYKQKLIYIAVVTKSDKDKIVQYSKSYSAISK